jgi:hypothetical protein
MCSKPEQVTYDIGFQCLLVPVAAKSGWAAHPSLLSVLRTRRHRAQRTKPNIATDAAGRRQIDHA